MSVLIGFSGACVSGKTTLIQRLEQDLDNVRVIDELIRSKNIKNLTTLRQEDPNGYLDIQHDIILRKIAQEDEAISCKDSSLVLADRSLADSLYYLTRYTAVDKLTPKNVERFYELVSTITNSWHKRYSKIVFLKPLNVKVDDHFRVENLKEIQQSEAKSILWLAEHLAPIKAFSAISEYTDIKHWIQQ